MTCIIKSSADLMHQLVFQKPSSQPPEEPLSSLDPRNDFSDDSLLFHPDWSVVKIYKLNCNLDLKKKLNFRHDLDLNDYLITYMT